MRKIIGCFIVLLFLLNCSDNSRDVQIKSVNNIWQKDVSQGFNIHIDKASETKNIYLLVRNNDDYPYANIRFFVEFKNNKTKKNIVDTLNYILAKPNGEWLGTGFGSTKEILLQYKMNYNFPNEGNYNIEIKQAMRKDTLVGIEDIGIKIENAKL